MSTNLKLYETLAMKNKIYIKHKQNSNLDQLLILTSVNQLSKNLAVKYQNSIMDSGILIFQTLDFSSAPIIQSNLLLPRQKR